MQTVMTESVRPRENAVAWMRAATRVGDDAWRAMDQTARELAALVELDAMHPLFSVRSRAAGEREFCTVALPPVRLAGTSRTWESFTAREIAQARRIATRRGDASDAAILQVARELL